LGLRSIFKDLRYLKFLDVTGVADAKFALIEEGK
jgi:hypothetical protein